MIPFSKSIEDCHQKIKDAFPACRELFITQHPGYDLKVDYTYRGPELQMALYQRGRELIDGVWNVVDPKLVVTHDDGTTKKSHHNVFPSQAADIYITHNGLILWGEKADEQALYIALGKIWESKGLVAGALWHSFKDWPHVQVANAIV